MKKQLFFSLLFLVVAAQSSFGQCLPRVATYSGYNLAPNTGCATFRNSGTYSPGTYFLLPMLLGGSYRVSTCGRTTIDTQITGFQGLTTATSVFYRDDNGPDCTGLQSSVDYTSTFTDFSRIAVQQYDCQPGGTSSITVGVRQNNNLTRTNSTADMVAGQTRTLTATPARVVTSPPSGAGNVGTFTGTGVSGTTFTAPTPGGCTGSYNNTYTFGYCTANQSITSYSSLAAAPVSAGPDQYRYLTSVPMSANTPACGTGTWTLVSGPAGTGITGGATNPNANTTYTQAGVYTWRWTITHGPNTPIFDDVVITIGIETFPVELAYFDGYEREHDNVLNWTTASEENFDHFELERSPDGANFDLFAKVNPQGGNSVKERHYDAIDNMPYFPITYYRLKMIDKDGKVDYSQMIEIKRSNPNEMVAKAYPNPFNDELKVDVSIPVDGTIDVKIIDLAGKILESHNKPVSSGINEYTFSTAHLPRGVYLVRIESGRTVETIKVVKQ